MIVTIGKKITFSFGIALFILGTLSLVSYRNITRSIDTADWVAHSNRVLYEISKILSNLQDTETGQRGYLIAGEDRYLEPYKVAVPKIDDGVEELRRLTVDNIGQQQRLNALRPLIRGKIAELQETIDLRKNKGFEAARQVVLTDRGKAIMDQIRGVLGEMENEENNLLKQRSEESIASAQTTITVLGLGSLLAIALVALVGVALQRSITRPLTVFMQFVERVGQGDLTGQAASGEDELGRLGKSLNQMVAGLRDVAGQTRAATENLNSAVAEILASAQQQASSTTEQATAIQQTTTTMQEISQSGTQVSERAKQVATAAEATSVASQSGLRAVQNTTRGMEAIRDQAEAVAENIVALSEKTQAVGDIIATVTDIAEQSNLLALNAAIEAAAAGEQGRSFSVVAGEMKSLADQAKEATVQVRSILGDIQKGINTSVMLTEEAVKRVESGKQQTDVADGTLRQMTDSIQESVQAFQQIVAATNQQQIGFDQVAQALQNIRQASEQTATGTRQMEKAAANLNALSQQLRKAVERYQV